MVKRLNDEEIKQIAENIYKGIIFTDRHLPKDVAKELHFLALLFLSKKELSKLKNVTMIYEYMDKSVPLGLNGYPMFFSFHYVIGKDTEKIWAHYNKIVSTISNMKLDRVTVTDRV